jgi:hypothetical protein
MEGRRKVRCVSYIDSGRSNSSFYLSRAIDLRTRALQMQSWHVNE